MPTAEELFDAATRGKSAEAIFDERAKSAEAMFDALTAKPSGGSVLETVGEVASGVRRKFGLAPDEPGPVESVLRYFGVEPKTPGAASAVAAADIPLRVVAAPFLGVGRAAQDVIELGGAAIGRGASALGLPVSPEAQQPTETPFSRGVGIAGTFATPGGGVIPLGAPATTRFGITSATRSAPTPTTLVEIAPAERPGLVTELLEQAPASRASLSQRESVHRTLEAAEELAAGRRPLDLGQVGQRRMALQGRIEPPKALPPAESTYLEVPRSPGTPQQIARITGRVQGRQPLAEAAAEEGVIPTVRPPTPAGAKPSAPKPLLTEEAAVRIEAAAGERLPDALKATQLSTKTTRSVIAAAERTMQEFGITRDPAMPVTMQVLGAMERHPEAFAAFQRSLETVGATIDDLAQMFLATSSTAGRQLGQLGTLAQRLGQHPETRALADALKRNQPPLEGSELAGHWWARFVNLWRGSLVTALSTAVRNAETQVARLSLEPVEKAVDVAIRGMFRLGGSERPPLGAEFRASLGTFHSLASRGRQQQVTEILRSFPDEADRLFHRFASDVAQSSRAARPMSGTAAAVEKAFDKAEAGVNVLNVFNRAQEFLVRRAAFRTKLDELARKRGASLDDLGPAEAATADVAKAVDHALEMTYSLTPKGGLGRAIETWTNTPMVFIAPFPRFLVNAWKFQFDYSPAAFLKVLSKAERAKLAEGDTASLSKAIVGSGLLYAAWEVRNSEHAGERWYEIKAGDRRYDMRPFAPFAAYLYVAELEKRRRDGTLSLTAEEMARGAIEAASGMRAGAGLFALDTIDDAIAGLMGDGRGIEKVSRGIRRFAGEVTSGFLQPLTTVRELLSDYGRFLGAERAAEEEGKLRERADEPFLGAIKVKIPGVSQTLPEKELPLRAETPRQEAVSVGGVPVSRQFTGLAIQARNRIEAEANRLALTRREIYGSFTGEPEADRLITKHMGEIAERRLPSLLTPRHETLTDAEKRVRWVAMLSEIRSAAAAAAARENPELFKTLAIRRSLNRREMELLKERGRLPEGVLR